MQVMGIDLGTSNTYIYVGLRGEDPAPLVLPEVSAVDGSVPTVVLYEDARAILIGQIAESEYHTNVRAMPRRVLRGQFKPEIADASSEAMVWMTDFLLLLRQALPPQSLGPDRALYVGIPARGRADFALNLGSCFEKAGWPKPDFVRESDAAMISCLQTGSIDINDIEHSALILDFGGGTCDCTWLEQMKVLENAGDPLYGGRLFDDLFFQLFCRHDPDFARNAPASPYAYYLHWIVCKTEKEQFSDWLNRHEGGTEDGLAMRIPWYDAKGSRHLAVIESYTRADFIRDAENYIASPQMLEMLGTYVRRGGLSAYGRDLLDGKSVGLISWLREILEKSGLRRDVEQVILTGGSCRWFFARDLVSELFPAATVSLSKRNYEDIAYGLAVYPALQASREKAKQLLEDKFEGFAGKMVASVRGLLDRTAKGTAAECAERIVEHDVMPVLEAAGEKSMTIAEMERNIEENMRADTGLATIIQARSAALEAEMQRELQSDFSRWLRENGVNLAPRFDFAPRTLSSDFVDAIRVRVTSLAFLNVMEFMVSAVLPGIAAYATAGVIAHAGEPVSAIVGGSVAFAGVWGLGKVARKFLWKRHLPRFFFSERNRVKIAEKNRKYIQKALDKSFTQAQVDVAEELMSRLRQTLAGMVARLGILNQVQVARQGLAGGGRPAS